MSKSRIRHRLLNYLSCKPEEQQSHSPFHGQTQMRDQQRQEAQVPQEVLRTDGGRFKQRTQHRREALRAFYAHLMQDVLHSISHPTI